MQQSDLLLLPFLHASHDEPEAETRLAEVITEHAAPIIKGIIKSKLHTREVHEHPSHQEAEDLYGEVVIQLLARLRALTANPDHNAIGDFRGYVAVTTYNACRLYLRQKYPERWHLKNRLRYVLSHDEDFSLWESTEGDWLCGLSLWRGRGNAVAASAERLRQLSDDPDALKRAGLEAGHARQTGLADLLRAIFQHTQAPIILDSLLTIIAGLQEMSERVVTVPVEDEDDTHSHLSEADMHTGGLATAVERRSYLRRLWAEIVQLPPMQRAALLLNLRDAHEGVITLLPLAGIAGVHQIAGALNMDAEKFARLWNELPLDDATIAGLLKITRQQVINLRKAARARLGRRMRLIDETRER
jgi:DNA-directed RNA polymerase specialized sigma24 family protein